MLRRCRWWISHLRFAFAHARAVAWMNAWRERQRMLYGSAAAHLAAFCALGAMRQIDQEYREQHQQVWMLGLGGSSETIPEAEQRWKSILRWREYDEADARIKAEEKRAKEHRVPPPRCLRLVLRLSKWHGGLNRSDTRWGRPSPRLMGR